MKPEARLVAARSRLSEAERWLLVATEVKNNALRACSFAERDLNDAVAMSKIHIGSLPMSGPAPKPPSAARDAHATAEARLKAAERDLDVSSRHAAIVRGRAGAV